MFTACDKDENNAVTITIEEPLNDEAVSDCSDVHIHIDIELLVLLTSGNRHLDVAELCLLVLPRQASNFGVKAELGRAPIFSFMCSQLIRYWIKIISIDANRLLKDAYLSELHIHNEGGASWVSFVIKLLQIH